MNDILPVGNYLVVQYCCYLQNALFFYQVTWNIRHGCKVQLKPLLTFIVSWCYDMPFTLSPDLPFLQRKFWSTRIPNLCSCLEVLTQLKWSLCPNSTNLDICHLINFKGKHHCFISAAAADVCTRINCGVLWFVKCTGYCRMGNTYVWLAFQHSLVVYCFSTTALAAVAAAAADVCTRIINCGVLWSVPF